MKAPNRIAHDTVERLASARAKSLSGDNAVSIATAAVEADRAQRDLIALIAEALDDRDATSAAQLVRDTDPDDDLWNTYIGPMLDSIEDDYTRMAQKSES